MAQELERPAEWVGAQVKEFRQMARGYLA